MSKTFKEIFPNFSTYKTKLNQFGSSTDFVKDSDEFFYNIFYKKYQNKTFTVASENDIVADWFVKWVDIKIDVVSILNELDSKAIKDLATSRTVINSYTGNNEDELSDDLEELVQTGNSNLFQPSIIAAISLKLNTFTKIYSTIFVEFSTLFANVGQSNSNVLNKEWLPVTIGIIEDALGIDIEKKIKEIFPQLTNPLVDTQHLEDGSVTRIKLEQAIQTLLETLTNKTTSNQSKTVANEKQIEVVKRNIGNYGNNLQTIDTKVEQNKNDIAKNKKGMGDIQTNLILEQQNISTNKVAIAKNTKKLDNFDVDVNKWHKGLNLDKKGVYKDIGGTLSNDNLKKAFEGGDGNNDEYLVFNDIIRNDTNLFKSINGYPHYALIKGNWLVNHLQDGTNIGTDFNNLIGTQAIIFEEPTPDTTYIYFYVSDTKIYRMIYNNNTGNYGSISLRNFSNSVKQRSINWAVGDKTLNEETPIFIDDEYKTLGNTFIKKGDIVGNVKTAVPFFTVLFKKDTNEFANSSNYSDNIDVIANNVEYMNDNPVEITQRNSSTIRVKLNFKKALPNGIFKLRLLLNKSKEQWVDFDLVNSNLFANYLYESVSNYSSSARNGSWRDLNPTSHPTNKEFFRSSGQQAEVNLIFGNNGIKWIYRTGTSSRASSWTSYGTHQVYHTGEIRSNDNTKLISGEPLIFDITGSGIILKKDTMIFLTEEIGL